jgi:thiol-disulfide isomerase/thioredoxin
VKSIYSFIKKHFSNIFLFALVLVFIFTGKFSVLKDRVESWWGKGQGTQIEDMTFNYLQGNKQIKLSSLKGKVVLINFWATWCPPCRIEIPSFIDIYSKTDRNKFEIIGVSIDNNGSEIVKQYIKEKSINYPITMANKEIISKFDEIVAVPTSFLLDKEGKVVKKYSGLYMQSTFENDIKSIID